MPTKQELLARRPRTRRALTPEDMERLYALYYDPSVPVSRVAAAFDVPGSTFLRWIDEMGWPKRRAGGIATRSQRPPGEDAFMGAPDVTGNPSVLSKNLMAAAYSELTAIQQEPLGVTIEERERRARLIESLSRSLQRADRSLIKAAEVDSLRRQVAAVRYTDPRRKEIREIEHVLSAETIKGIPPRVRETEKEFAALIKCPVPIPSP